jgi:cob(I)alamin adenosyltransferase
MGNRLTKITTRTGDDGQTGLADGRRIPKCDPRIEAIGAVDETNSALGVVLSTPGVPPALAQVLVRVQHELFDLGAELSLPQHHAIGTSQIAHLEQALERFNADLPPLREFVLPGGTPAAAHCHVARAICRRAERCAWVLVEREVLRAEVPRYLNRLSDLLFVAARTLARQAGGREILWQSPRVRSDGPAE